MRSMNRGMIRCPKSPVYMFSFSCRPLDLFRTLVAFYKAHCILDQGWCAAAQLGKYLPCQRKSAQTPRAATISVESGGGRSCRARFRWWGVKGDEFFVLARPEYLSTVCATEPARPMQIWGVTLSGTWGKVDAECGGLALLERLHTRACFRD